MNTTLSIIIPLLSAFLGGYISFYFSSKSKKEEAIIKFREEKYANLLMLLKGFVGNTASDEMKSKFFDEQYKSWIYSSDEVVLAINKLVQLVIDGEGKAPNPIEGRQAIGKIVLAVRKDLLKKTSLTFEDFRYTDVVKKRTHP